MLLAIAATVIGAIGARGALEPLLLGARAPRRRRHVDAVRGERAARRAPRASRSSRRSTNSSVGLAALAIVAAVTLATHDVGALPANPLLYLGGLLGAFVVVVGATAVQTLGVLRLGLATVAGPDGRGARHRPRRAGPRRGWSPPATVIGVVLTLVAVVVSGRGRRAR